MLQTRVYIIISKKLDLLDHTHMLKYCHPKFSHWAIQGFFHFRGYIQLAPLKVAVLFFGQKKIQFSRFFHENIDLDCWGCPQMIYKIWLNKFENWIFPGHVKKGNFFTFYLKKYIYCASLCPGKIQIFNLFHKKIALPKLYTNDSKLNYISFWLTEMIKTKFVPIIFYFSEISPLEKSS